MNEHSSKAGAIAAGSIVVGVDDAASAADAVAWAVAEAEITRRAITLVHVIPPVDAHERMWLARAGITGQMVITEERESADALLEAVAAPVRDAGVTVRLAVEVGDARRVLPTFARDAYRLVVGSRGRGPLASWLLGSVGSAVVRTATCPVVVVRPRVGAKVAPSIVVSASATAEGHAALEAAFLEAEGRQRSLTIVACDPDGEPNSGPWSIPADGRTRDVARLAIAEAVAGLQEDHPDVAASTFVAEGDLLPCLLDLGDRSEEIVIERPAGDGERGHFGAAGSLAAALVEHASTTVMVVP